VASDSATSAVNTTQQAIAMRTANRKLLLNPAARQRLGLTARIPAMKSVYNFV
jgi:hypothetical protein